MFPGRQNSSQWGTSGLHLPHPRLVQVHSATLRTAGLIQTPRITDEETRSRSDLPVVTASVSEGCLDKFPQAARLNTAEMYSLTVVESRSPKSRGWHCPAPSAGSRGPLFLASSSSRGLQAFLGLCPHHSDLCLCLHVAFPSVSAFSSLSLDVGPTQIIQDYLISRWLNPLHVWRLSF